MYMSPVLIREFWRLVVLASITLLIGFISDAMTLSLLIGSLLYSSYLLVNLAHLQRWLETHRQTNLPDASGLWGNVFNELYQLDRHTERALDELQDMASRFQEAASALPDAMVILGTDQVIEWFNPMARQLLGFVEQTDTGRPITNLIRHPGFRAFLEAPYSGDEYEMQSPALPLRHLSVRRAPYGSNHELLIARDITRVHKLETMRSQFIGNVSHELRSPITVLSGYLETLKDNKEHEPVVLNQAIQTMYDQARRMERLVTDLLALSRLETDQAMPGDNVVEIKPLLAGLIEAATVLSGEAKHIITLEADTQVNLKGNHSELHSLFANLINNAVCYTPPGGEIHVKWMTKGDGAQFSVTDTGPGIAPQHLSRLTERFYRVDVDRSRETGGTGLGLAIVKHVLDRHGGKLTIDSDLGQGSTFTCTFPAERVVSSASHLERAGQD